MKELNQLWENWIQKQNSHSKYKSSSKKYLHFDRRFSLYNLKGNLITKNYSNLKNKLLFSPQESIPKHPFYPFIYFEISSKKYKYSPTDDKGIYKPKVRPISYAAHLDSLIFSWYAFLLSSEYEKRLSENSLNENILAYRSIEKKSTIDFANEVFNQIKTRRTDSVLAIDISGFFDNIKHVLLKKSMNLILETKILPPDYYHIYKAITNFSIIEKNYLLDEFGTKNKTTGKEHFKNRDRICKPEELRNFLKNYPEAIFKNYKQKGIPQGSPISALLSNIFLFEFDKSINSAILKIGGLYRRYSDDIIVICKKEKIGEIYKEILLKLEDCDLKINSKKTEINHFEIIDNDKLRCYKEVDGKKNLSKVQYLGFDFSGTKVNIRPSSLSRYYKKVRKSAKKIGNDLYSKNSVPNQIFKKEFYSRYSTRGLNNGNTNFIGYILLANNKMKSRGIKKQIDSHFKKINDILSEEIKRKQNSMAKLLKGKKKEKKNGS